MAFPPKSKADLIKRALFVLGAISTGQPPNDDDVAKVEPLIEPLFARLNAEKITYHRDAEGNVTQLTDSTNIPAAQFLDLAVLLADAAKQDFGLSALPQDDPMKSEVRLRTIYSVGATQEEYEVEVTDLDTDTTTTETHRRNITLVGEYF